MICQWLMCLFVATSFYITEPSLIPNLNFTFKDPKGKYVFHYPTNWVKEESIKGIDLFITAPKSADGRSTANINIISHELPPGMDLDAFVSTNKDSMLKVPSIKMIDEGRYEIAGQLSKWMRWTKDDQYEGIQYILVLDGTAIVITAGAPKDVFKDYVETFGTIVKTLSVTKKN